MANKGAFSEFLTTYQSERKKTYGEDEEVAQKRKKTASMCSGHANASWGFSHAHSLLQLLA